MTNSIGLAAAAERGPLELHLPKTGNSADRGTTANPMWNAIRGAAVTNRNVKEEGP